MEASGEIVRLIMKTSTDIMEKIIIDLVAYSI